MSQDPGEKAALLRRCREAIEELAQMKDNAAKMTDSKVKDTRSAQEDPKWDPKFPG